MANLIRGEVPFRAAGRDLFVQYGTREIAEAQTALGFHRPDPYQRDVVEEVDEAVAGKVDEAGLQVFRRQRVLIDAAERQRRMVAAFEACVMRPDPEASVVFLRVGLQPWQRSTGTKLSDDDVWAIVNGLGLAAINLLHWKAISNGSYLKGEEDGGEGSGKAESAVSASST
jgi:hypothetical protein